MIRTMILIPMIAAVLACGVLTKDDDPTTVVIELPAMHDEGPAAPIVDPLTTKEGTVEVLGESRAGTHGDTLIEEKIFGSNAIMEATMTSLSSEVVVDADDKYTVVLKFNLDVSEYLKGTGPSSIVAVWVDGWSYDTNDEASNAKAILLAERDDQWDDREAVIFLYGVGSGFGASLDAQLQLADHVLLYVGDPYSSDDFYSLHSREHKRWLPAASGSGLTGDGQEFLLDVPPATGTAPTITLGDLKTRIAEVAAEFRGGDGSEAYETCVTEKYQLERVIRYFRDVEGIDAIAEDRRPQDSSLVSGQPANTQMHQRLNAGFYPDQKAKTWLEGRDSDLFTVSQGEPTAFDFDGDGSFTAGSDGIEFTETFATARPLPAGEYEIVRNEVWARYVLCDYVLSHEWTVTVEAPEGTLHEAFFDPVTDGTAVAADGTNGVLKPATFKDADGAAATIERIEWESGTVKFELSSDDALAGHVVDFIELDGTVSLSLNADQATVDAENDTLSWSVASQPWENGDELMVRVRRGPCWNDTAVPNPADNPGLMRDCINLLAAKDALQGTATLNWSVDTPISEWDGVRVLGSPSRVTRLQLTSEGLTGTIPPDLARLDGLEFLWLNYNQLTGEIPAALGNLASLKSLTFNHNLLTGAVPRELGDLSRLESIWLNENQLSGEIPASLGDLSNLRQLLLAGNRLSGAIPSVLGDLSNLESLKLNYNQLTGEIPSALGRLSNLKDLLLGDNQLTGCIPPALRNVEDNDLDSLGLQDCSTP